MNCLIGTTKVGTKKRCMKLRHAPLSLFLKVLTLFLTLYLYGCAEITIFSMCLTNSSLNFNALSLAPF